MAKEITFDMKDKVQLMTNCTQVSLSVLLFYKAHTNFPCEKSGHYWKFYFKMNFNITGKQI